MTFQALSSYLEKLEKTTSRNEITRILAELFKKTSTSEIDKICYLVLGKLVPAYRGIEFNLAEKMMVKILAVAYGVDPARVVAMYKRSGDLGDTAYQISKIKYQKSKISIGEVYERLMKVALEAGKGSQERKIGKMAKLFGELDGQSAKFVARIPVGKLRLGFSDATILDALSVMEKGDKSARVQIEAVFNARADIGQIAKLIKEKGLRGLAGIKVSLGTPIMPALCQRLPTVEEMIEKMGQVAVEPKYDGTRLQLHAAVKSKMARIFTRNLENVTEMFPDLVKVIPQEVKGREVILDGEAIGFNPKTGKFLPFQETIKRKRKYEIAKKAKEIPLKFFCFDILSKDGRDLLAFPFEKRRQILEKTLPFSNKTLILSPQIVTASPHQLRQYYDEQIERGLEGVVVKKWQAPYDPGRRGYTWVKFKQEKGKKGGGLADTIDCLVMGYYKGRGKRASFGIGAFLVGIKKSAKEDQFLTISKIGTGLTDEQWRELKLKIESAHLAEKIEEKPKEYAVDKNLFPDVWCLPKIVVEIEADNITKSPVHTAAFALRFPRLVRFRDDKNPQQTTTLKEVKKLSKL